MKLLSLATSNFRNLETGSLSWGPETNLILGGNGEGKTNLLEALAVSGNLRSFRGASPRVIVRHGASSFRLVLRVERGGGEMLLEQDVTVGPPVQRSLSIQGQGVSVSSYLQSAPVFSLSSSDGLLVVGAPHLRRALLDRVAFLRDSASLKAVHGYQRLLRQRTAALARGAGSAELDAWEARLAACAAEVVDRRLGVFGWITPIVAKLYNRMRKSEFPDLELRYAGEPFCNGRQDPAELEELYRKRYNETRARDRQAGHTPVGPHRHDLRLLADGRPVRDVLSSGQIKVVAAALRLASVVSVEEGCGERFPVVIDDVDAELDRAVLATVVAVLAGGRQLFVSSARAEMVARELANSHTVVVHRGTVRPAAAPGE